MLTVEIYSGKYGNGSVIHLSENALTGFESGVFLPVLKQMAPSPGYPTTLISITDSIYALNTF